MIVDRNVFDKIKKYNGTKAEKNGLISRSEYND